LKLEQRRFKRHVVQENGFEVLSREFKINGKLRDISEGGLSYQYTPFDRAGSESEVVDILGTGPDRFLLPGLDCKRAYDITELATGHTFSGTEIRLRGLEYTGLTEEQKQKLAVLMANAHSA
jgi:hypothetical protein